MVGKQILPSGLRADINLDRQYRVFAKCIPPDRIGSDFHPAMLTDSNQQLIENFTVNSMEQIVMFKTEVLQVIIKLVEQKRPDYTKRITFREESSCILPGIQRYIITAAPECQFTSDFIAFQQTKRFILLQLLPYSGIVKEFSFRETGKVIVCQHIHNLLYGKSLFVRQQIENTKMQKIV